jgi:hypothetical protein
MNISQFISYQVVNIAVMTVILLSTLKFGLDNTVNCSQVVAPECQGVSTAYIRGTSINGTTIITKRTTDAVGLLQGVCEIANTEAVFVISEQITIKPNLPSEDVIAVISYNTGLLVGICVLEAAMIVNFMIVIMVAIHKSRRYSIIE